MSTASEKVTPYRAAPDEARVVAELLHQFNTEFDVSSPGITVLAGRLQWLLAQTTTIVYLVDQPADGVAVITLRSNVWYDGPVALLDELYVRPHRRGQGLGSALIQRLVADASAAGIAAIEINVDEGDVDAQRFYERHGFTWRDADTGERAFYFSLEL